MRCWWRACAFWSGGVVPSRLVGVLGLGGVVALGKLVVTACGPRVPLRSSFRVVRLAARLVRRPVGRLPFWFRPWFLPWLFSWLLWPASLLCVARSGVVRVLWAVGVVPLRLVVVLGPGSVLALVKSCRNGVPLRARLCVALAGALWRARASVCARPAPVGVPRVPCLPWVSFLS